MKCNKADTFLGTFYYYLLGPTIASWHLFNKILEISAGILTRLIFNLCPGPEESRQTERRITQ